MNTDCIYFKEHQEDSEWPDCCECTRTSKLALKEDGDDLCSLCRLWDAYIPKGSAPEEIEKAQRWQNMSYKEQPDYEDYF